MPTYRAVTVGGDHEVVGGGDVDAPCDARRSPPPQRRAATIVCAHVMLSPKDKSLLVRRNGKRPGLLNLPKIADGLSIELGVIGFKPIRDRQALSIGGMKIRLGMGGIAQVFGREIEQHRFAAPLLESEAQP